MKDIALVYCFHANPSLGASSLISTFLQDFSDYTYDLHFIYQVGPEKEYPDMIEGGFNSQLSLFDDRVEELTDIKLDNIFRWKFQNDQALDSGAWWKWMLYTEKVWENYRYVWFLGEGALFSCNNSVQTTIRFADQKKAHFIAPGHEKRRIPKKYYWNSYENTGGVQSLADRFHNQMIRKVFKIFCRDPDFQLLIDEWEEKEFKPEEIIMAYNKGNDIRYIEEPGAEWYGCSTCNFMSSKFILDLYKRTKQYLFDECLEKCYSGTPLEVIWGFFPQLLGYKKYFSDALFRPRKNKPFIPSRMRVDTPEGYLRYLTKYYGEVISVKPVDDLIKITKLTHESNHLRQILPEIFFAEKKELDPVDKLGLSYLKIYSKADYLFLKGRLREKIKKLIVS